MSINVLSNTQPLVDSLPFELVERKGVGHPDTICDAIAERASRAYSRHCLERWGRIAHHWFDKVMLIGGESRLDYGHGELIKPYKVFFAGKGAYRVGEEQIPLAEILHQAAADVLSEVLTGFRPEVHLETHVLIVDHQGAGRANPRYRPESPADLLTMDDPKRTSNDSNLLSSFAPLSRLETLVLRVEQFVNGPIIKREMPFTGWDVKVLGERHNDSFKLLVNVPFLAEHVTSLEHYHQLKQQLQVRIQSFCASELGLEPALTLNATDRNGRPYLTSLGSVADTGDVGVVGRGNRSNGLITPMRSMSIEAPAGKNPLDHTGKLYTVLASRIAQAVHEQCGKPVDVCIFTSKEAPLDNPDNIVVKISSWEPTPAESAQVDAIVSKLLANVSDVTRGLVLDGITMW